MDKEKIQSIAFMIIANAGSAFNHFYRAIEMARKNDFDQANTEMKAGEANLTLAHRSQTDILTAEANEKDIPFSILMVHAQDHLTMAIFTQQMAREFIYLYQDKYGKV